MKTVTRGRVSPDYDDRFHLDRVEVSDPRPCECGPDGASCAVMRGPQ